MTPMTVKNHLTAMKKQLLSESKVSGVGRILGDSSFRRIPAVSSFKVKKQPYNQLLMELGIKLRLPKGTEIEILKDQNKMNKYMSHIISRIRTEVSAGNSKKA